MGRLGFTSRVVNPSARTYKWSGQWLDDNDKPIKFEERFTYWHKDEDNPENSKRVAVKPFEFAVVGVSMAVGGFDSTLRKGLYSNEVLYQGNWKEAVSQNVVVKADGETLFEGSIADALEHNADFKRVLNLYIYNFETKQIERWTTGAGQQTVRDMLFGSNDFKGVDVESKVFSLVDHKAEKVGSTKFASPVVKVTRDIKEEENAILDEVADTVSNYLRNQAHLVVSTTTDGVYEPEVAEEENGEIDLSDVPF